MGIKKKQTWGLQHIVPLQIMQPECLPVSVCRYHEKFGVYFGIRDMYQSNLTSAFEVGGEQHHPFPVLKSAAKLHFTHKHFCSSVVFWLFRKIISLDRHHQQVSPLCRVSSQPSHIVKMTQTKLLNLGHWYSMCYAGVHTSNALNSKFLN